MKNAVLALLVVSLAPAPDPAGFRPEGHENPVALVVEMTPGANATCTTRGGSRTSLERFAWLPEGCRVEALCADLLVAFETGARYRFTRGARFTVSADGPRGLSGKAEAVERIPPLPRLVLSPEAKPGASRGGIRIRGGVPSLYPAAPARSLAATTVLTFVPMPGARGYRLVVKNAEGAIVWQGSSSVPEVSLPAGLLRPESAYRWTVMTEGLEPELASEADFATLSLSEEEGRQALRAALAGDDSSANRALLAAVDLHLGLLAEARAGFVAAQAQEPSSSLTRSIEGIDRLLAAGPRSE